MTILLIGLPLITALIGYAIADIQGRRRRIDMLRAMAERLEGRQ